MTWVIRYICYCNLQFLNNVIIIKTKVPLPQAEVNIDDLTIPFLALYCFIAPEDLKTILLSNI
jgi:hypothetical protein